MRILGGGRALDLVRSQSQPDDVAFYADLELAADRLVDGLVNALTTSERVLAFAAGPPESAPTPATTADPDPSAPEPSDPATAP